MLNWEMEIEWIWGDYVIFLVFELFDPLSVFSELWAQLDDVLKNLGTMTNIYFFVY
jgi:hypothetical protein